MGFGILGFWMSFIKRPDLGFFMMTERVEMDFLAFIDVVDPTKVRIVERGSVEGEAKLLDSTVGRVVPLLPVASARVESELKASVEKLFDEGGSTEQVDFTVVGGHDAEIEFVTAAEDTATGNVAAEWPKRPRKKSEVVIGGKSLSVIKELLASSILSVEAGVSAMPTLPFVTSSVSATPGREDGAPLDSVTGVNLCTVGSAVYCSSSSDYRGCDHHQCAHVSPVLVPRVADKVIPQNVSNDSQLDDLDTSREFIDHLAPPVLFAQIRNIDYEELFTEFNVGSARQACLSAEVRMQTEYCLSERKRLKSECERQADLLKSRDEEVSAFEVAKKVHVDELNFLRQKNVALEDERNSLDGKVTELQSLVSTKDRELKDFDATVTSLKSQNDSLVDQVHARSGYHQKDRKPSQNDKTEHGMEKTVQNQGQSPKMPKSESILMNQQSNRSRN
ncbi:hypothetical protein Tco_1242704 [Tanacetum coccineum]